jgi:hypothetical protein
VRWPSAPAFDANAFASSSHSNASDADPFASGNQRLNDDKQKAKAQLPTTQQRTYMRTASKATKNYKKTKKKSENPRKAQKN